MQAQFEKFAVPDATPAIKASDFYYYDRLRVITDAHHFIVPAILLLAGVFFWLGLRIIFRGAAGRTRRLITLWLDAKEQELRTRAGKDRA